MNAIANRFAFRAADADLDALDAIVAGLRTAGHVRCNRSTALRFAIATAAAKFAPNAALAATATASSRP